MHIELLFTGYSLFTLMYGYQPKSLAFSGPKAFDPASYQAHLQAKYIGRITLNQTLPLLLPPKKMLMTLILQHETLNLMTQCGYPYVPTL